MLLQVGRRLLAKKHKQTQSKNNSNKNNDKVQSPSAKTSNLRWDHGNTQAYYENTGNLLYPRYNSLLGKYTIMLKERKATNVSVPSNAYNDYILILKLYTKALSVYCIILR